MTGRCLVVFVVALVVAALAGCNTGQQSNNPPPELAPKASPAIADVPMPEGFEYDESASRHQVAGGLRLIDHTYTGRKDKYDVLRFYRKQMAANQWTLMRETMLRGDIVMDYDKGNERCSITINKDNWLSPTRVRVVLSPVGKVDLPAAPPPK